MRSSANRCWPRSGGRPRLPVSKGDATRTTRADVPGTPGGRPCSAASWSPSAGTSRMFMRRWSRTSRKWLLSHRSEKVGARNVEALSDFFADPAHKGLSAPPANSKQARRERTQRLILLGAWVLARRKTLNELRDLVAAELARFLEQGQRVERHKALLKDVLGK